MNGNHTENDLDSQALSLEHERSLFRENGLALSLADDFNTSVKLTKNWNDK